MTVKTLFTDVGGVLLTNGWDTSLREEAAKQFNLDFDEMEERHKMSFPDYETGRISLEEYIRHLVFYKPRTFSFNDFRDFIFNNSESYPEMLELIKEVKKKMNLKIATLSNEGKEIAIYRFNKFKFHEFIDYFIVSSFVHLQKPDPRIYKMALDIAQTKPSEAIYIDDREAMVSAGKSAGLNAFQHKDYESTKKFLLAILG